jgi:hypothetical protein
MRLVCRLGAFACVHHFFVTQWPNITPAMWLSFVLAALAAVFSFVGGYLLLTGKRA